MQAIEKDEKYWWRLDGAVQGGKSHRDNLQATLDQTAKQLGQLLRETMIKALHCCPYLAAVRVESAVVEGENEQPEDPRLEVTLVWQNGFEEPLRSAKTSEMAMESRLAVRLLRSARLEWVSPATAHVALGITGPATFTLASFTDDDILWGLI